MTGKGVLVQGVLAALGLGAVYVTWQREPDRAAGEVTVLNLGKKDLTSIHYEDEQSTVDLFQAGETAAGEPDVWVKIAEKAKGAATDKASLEKLPASSEKPPSPPREFRGAEAAGRLWNDFAPLRSARAFGVLDAAKAKELGVDEASAKKKLTVATRAQTFSFVMGQPPAHGSGETYLRELSDGKVFLASRLVVGDLQGASHRLVDRRLQDWRLGDFDQLVVTAAGKTRKLVIMNKLEPNELKLASASSPDKPDTMLKTWHEKVWRLTPTDVLGKGETPPEGTPKVDVRIDYLDGGKAVGWVELAHVDKAEPPSAPPSKAAPAAQSSVLFARSSHTAGWVKLASDPLLLSDSEKVASGS